MLDFLLGNDALSAVIAFGLVLIPVIIIHELGHFLAAKAVGITILEFGIGFPPRALVLFTRGETEYTLNWLPIGGFVRPLGEDFVRPLSEEETEKERAALIEAAAGHPDDYGYDERKMLKARGFTNLKSVNEAGPFQRIFFMAAGALANAIAAFILFIIIGLAGLPTLMGGSLAVISIEEDSVFAEAGLQSGDLITHVNGEYFSDGVGFLVTLTELSGQTSTLTIQSPDENGDYQSRDISFTPALGEITQAVFVSAVAVGSPAEQAGIQPDDVVLALNGEPFAVFDDLREGVIARAGETITLQISRQGELMEFSLVPRVNPPPEEGAIGVSIIPAYQEDSLVIAEGTYQQAIVPLSFNEAVVYSVNQITGFVQTLINLPGDLLSGRLSGEEARFVSPLAISQVGAVFLQQSIEQNQPVMILQYIATISIALGLTNLLPLPALDGGRILFVIIEIIRGRPISAEREGMVHLIGIALLLSIMILTFLNDIMNPIMNSFP
jgi:regulator of sigma E protease